jgi:peptide/nickel transport system permease protein
MAETKTKEKPPRPEYKSYGDIVWEQFRKYPLAYYSLYGIFALFVIAIIAPVIALNVPFYVSVSEATSGVEPGTYFPWFAALFDANFFESGVDIFFNFLFFALPLNALVWLGYRTTLDPEDAKNYKAARRNFIIISTLALVVLATGIYFYGYRQPYVDWVTVASAESASALFPIFEFSYRDVDLNSVALDPSWEHWLGTDREGRDVFTRLLYGTRISLTIGVVAVAIYVSIGIVLGSLAGYFGGKVDMLVLRLIEVMICFPTLFLILTLRGFIDNPSIFHIMVIIGVTSWPRIARLVRGEFLRLKNQEFVQAAKALGLLERKVIFRHVLPNALGPLFVAATFGVAGAILIEATLSFLGLGSPTTPSWGQILTTGRQTQQYALILAPGFAIFLTVSLLNLLGDGVRDAIDPKLRK